MDVSDEEFARKLQEEEYKYASFGSRINNFESLISNRLDFPVFPTLTNTFTQPNVNMQGITGDESYEALLRLDDNVVKVGMDKHKLHSLPTFQFQGKKANEEENSCICCMSDYENGDELRRLTCFHSFHKDCIDEWLKENHKCPICKIDLNEQ